MIVSWDSLAWWGAVASYGLGACYFLYITVVYRRERKRQREQLDELIGHAAMLDRLLGSLCITACRREHEGVWRAWVGTMGSINVQVQGERKVEWEDEA